MLKDSLYNDKENMFQIHKKDSIHNAKKKKGLKEYSR